MLSRFPFYDEWMRPHRAKRIFRAARWNQYAANWSITLAALRRLWEMGKVSELRSPYYETFDQRMGI